jgi:hypothetical protein
MVSSMEHIIHEKHMPKRRRIVRAPDHIDFRLRLPPELHQRLIRFADSTSPPISLNKAILQILDDALIVEGFSIKAKVKEFSKEQLDEIRELIFDVLDSTKRRRGEKE